MKPDEQWRNIEGPLDEDLTALINMNAITRLPSSSPLEKIKRNLLINSLLGMLIVAFYIFIIASFPLWQVQLSIGIVLLFTLWGIYTAMQLFLKINAGVSTNSCLDQMQLHYNSIHRWMSVQQNIGLLLYPVSTAGGFMLGGYVGSGKPIEVFMGNPIIIIILLALIAILVPLCYKLTKWMTKKAFGQYADQLKINIDALKSEQ